MKSILTIFLLLSAIFSYGQKRIVIKKDTIRQYPKGHACKCLAGSYSLEKDSTGRIREVHIEADLRTFYVIDTIKSK